MNHLYFVRHGENRANITKEFSHHLVDYSLTPKGVQQAEQTAEYFASRPLDAVYASPLKRTRETAAIIAAPHSLSVTVLEALREVNTGDLEGRPPTDENWALHNFVLAEWFAGHPDVSFPGGENYHQLWKRTRAALTEIVAGKSGQHIVVVGHGGMTITTLRDLCHNIDLNWWRTAKSDNCSITEIALELRDGVLHGELVRWASTAHLHGYAAELVPGIPQVEPRFKSD